MKKSGFHKDMQQKSQLSKSEEKFPIVKSKLHKKSKLDGSPKFNKTMEKLYSEWFEEEKQHFYSEEEVVSFANWIVKKDYHCLPNEMWIHMKDYGNDFEHPKLIADSTKKLLNLYLKSKK